MLKLTAICGMATGLLVIAALAAEPPDGAKPAAASPLPRPLFAADGSLQRPTGYREWQYVTSGLGMSYGPAAQAAALTGHVMFDNVFVQPAAYREFRKKGVWPEGTMFVLELRGTETNRPPNNSGYFQTDIHGVEVSVKDSKRFDGRWAYFDFGMDAKSASPEPKGNCFACHAASAAVDMTFVQFYPTLQDVKPAR